MRRNSIVSTRIVFSQVRKMVRHQSQHLQNTLYGQLLEQHLGRKTNGEFFFVLPESEEGGGDNGETMTVEKQLEAVKEQIKELEEKIRKADEDDNDDLVEELEEDISKLWKKRKELKKVIKAKGKKQVEPRKPDRTPKEKFIKGI